jgi:hypothetical protein
MKDERCSVCEVVIGNAELSLGSFFSLLTSSLLTNLPEVAMDRAMHVLDFMELNMDIQGEFNGNVYHRKRNDEVEKYPYEPVSYYERTALVIRGEWIRKYVSKVSNPLEPDYSFIVKKLYYYTPYILPEGEQKILAETGFYVREQGDYELRWQGMPAGVMQKLCRRTEVKLNFPGEGEFLLQVFHKGELYCERNFIITGGDPDLYYDNWLAAHFEEILALAEPEFESLKTYRRGLRSKRNWIINLEGKCLKEVLYTRKDLEYKDGWRLYPWMYHHRDYDHGDNPQTQYFGVKMKEVGNSWQQLSFEEKAEWAKKEELLWQQQGRSLHNPRMTGFNLFTKYCLRE